MRFFFMPSFFLTGDSLGRNFPKWLKHFSKCSHLSFGCFISPYIFTGVPFLRSSALSFLVYFKQHFLFQIDPALLQQTLQQGGLLPQPLSVDTGLVSHSGSQLMSTTDPSVSANVVIHPLTSLALQPSAITPAQVTMAGLSEQDTTGISDGLGWVYDQLDTLSYELNDWLTLSCRFPGSKPCHGQLWIDSWRPQRTGDHADNQQSQSDSSPCLSILFRCCRRKPSGDHSNHIRYGPVKFR